MIIRKLYRRKKPGAVNCGSCRYGRSPTGCWYQYRKMTEEVDGMILVTSPCSGVVTIYGPGIIKKIRKG